MLTRDSLPLIEGAWGADPAARTGGRVNTAALIPATSWRRRRGGLPWLAAASVLIALLFSIPVLTVGRALLLPTDGIWGQFLALTLPRYLANTIGLLVGVGAGVLVLGVGCAWLVTMCHFPGRGWCAWLLLLPMAVPAYILAYTYADLLQYAGPVQSTLRSWFGWGRGEYWFPEIRSLGGAIVIMTFVLYPYVYLLARAAFLEQSQCVLDVSRTLGHGPWACFWRVALPLARPSIMAGVALAGMEALADFGTVKHFEVDTFTTGIYLTWFNLGSPLGAAKLAAILLSFVLTTLAVERWSRRGRRFHHATPRYRRLAAYRPRGPQAAAALVACLLPPVIGFFIPGAALLYLSLTVGDPLFGPAFARLAGQSLGLAALAGMLAVLLATVIAYGARLTPSPLLRGAAAVATLGYAVPGSVIAVGVLLPFGWFDNALDALARASLGRSTGLLLSGTLVALVFAYLVRFLALAAYTVEAGLSRISPSMDGAARTLGHGPAATLGRVHAPLLRGSLLTAGLLVFVDTLKELPATLIVRPFNFDTLAIRVYQLASDERLAQASTAALAIVAVGLIPVALLSLAIARARPGGTAH